MNLREGITFSYTEGELKEIPGANDRMSQYWIKVGESHVSDSSVCWLYRYALNGGANRGKAQEPSRELFDAIFDFSFEEFHQYVIQKGSGKTSGDPSWWAGQSHVRYNKNFSFSSYFYDFLASSDHEQDMEDALSSSGFEGGKKVRYSTEFERDKKLRTAALKKHGYTCAVCKFNFKEKYGVHGENYIQVHHKKPLSKTGPTITTVETDMVVLCANCHVMIHRRKDKTLTIEELMKLIEDEELKRKK
jgi:hypothetical protein